MLSSILTKTLYDRRRGLMWWSIGMVALALIMMGFYPTVRDQGEQFAKLLEAYPEGMLALFGMGGEDSSSFFTPSGYLKTELFSFMAPILFLILGIGAGAAAIAGEEERGTLDLLLSNPVSRHSVLLQKFLAMLAVLVGMGLVFFVALLLGAQGVDMQIGIWLLASGVISVVLLGLSFGTIALALGAATGKRALALGVTSALAVAGYLVNAFSGLASWLEPYRVLTLFYQYMGAEPLQNGLDLGHTLVFVLVIALLLVLALLRFERRDLSV